MIYLELFWSFFQIGLFSIGGGYAAMPLIQNQVVDIHPWLTMTQFADIMTIAEMTPGPIAINSATFVGIQVAGLPGAVIATVGCVFPSCVIVMTLAYIYAIHGQTTAEVVYTRADAEKEFMGLTTFSGSQPTLKEAVVAKNYLSEKELRAMGQLVSGYLDFAERQAEREQAMTMQNAAARI